MQKFNTFYFEGFEFDKTSFKAKFFYSFDKKENFIEEIDFLNNEFNLIDDINESIINNLLFNLSIAIGISYYKIFPTNKLVIESGFLNKNQIRFWKKFYLNGLGEFFIKNDFDFKKILNFENSLVPLLRGINNNFSLIRGLRSSSLLMWGGGKDSIVSSILLEEEKNDFDTFVFGKIDKIKKDTLKVLGKKTMLVKRKLSENLFKLNKDGYYNGHIPITGIIAFISLISAYLYDYKNIVLSNEFSASEENTIWKGLKINHQYSKSAEFEKDFRKYVENYIGDINYYSKLKDKTELEIAEIFTKKAKRYFTTFSSCNKNFVINGKKQEKNWCCNCEKCAFVYLILSPKLEENEINSIFGENLFENKNLLNTYLGLLNLGKNKPFECVGTYEESIVSFKKILYIYENKIKFGENKKLPYILDEIKKNIIYEKKNKICTEKF